MALTGEIAANWLCSITLGWRRRHVHRVHGRNIQVIAGPDGTILWTSGAMPGKIHDLRAAHVWGILRELDKAGILTLAAKGYHGAAETVVITPYKGKNKPESQRQANRSHAKLRGPGERANARLKSWRILRKLRCGPSKAGHLAKAIAFSTTVAPLTPSPEEKIGSLGTSSPGGGQNSCDTLSAAVRCCD